MSTTNSSTRKHHAATPSFPPELWLAIFEWATFVPNAFDTHVPDPFAYPPPWSQEQIQEGIRQSMVSKRYIVLVCKSWNALATRFLYKAIVLRHSTTVWKLLRALTIPAPAASGLPGTCNARGWWTLRLDVSIGRLPKDYSMLDRDGFERLLRCLPNLEIFVLRKMGPRFTSPGFFFDSLATLATRSLRVLDVSTDDHFTLQESRKLSCIVNGQPLRLLKYWPHLLLGDAEIQALLPQVEYLHVPWQLLQTVLRSGSASSVLHLCMDASLRSECVFRNCLSIAGPRLTSLEVEDTLVLFNFHQTRCTAIMRDVAEACPNLRELIIARRIAHVLLPTDFIPPVRRLGLRLCYRQDLSKAWWRNLCGILARLVEQTPTIEVIRIISKPSLQDLANHHSGVLKALQIGSFTLIALHNVRFEDCAGRLFHELAFSTHREVFEPAASLEMVTQGLKNMTT